MICESKQNNDTLCRGLRIGLGIAMVALGTMAVEGFFSTVLIVIGICILVSGIAWACPCTTFLGADKANSLCCLNCLQGKTDTCLSQLKGGITCN